MYSINHVLRYFKFIFLGVVLLISCDNGENSVNEKLNTTQQNPEIPLLAVKPPIPGLDIPFKTYSISTSKGYTIETPKGTTVDIPANAFVDKNGKTITGDVDIKFREFHDASEIIASGIPMHNPQTGEFMETAGMFEIKGEYEGEEIFIKGDKEIQVNLASYNEGDNFNFYKLGPKDCRWEEKGTAKATVNLNKKVRLLELENKMAQKPIGPRKHKNIKNYVFDLQVNYDMYPELKPFKGIVWEYAGKGEDPEKNNWIFSSNWDEINS